MKRGIRIIVSILSFVATGCLACYSIVLAVRTDGWAYATNVGSDVIFVIYCTAGVAIKASLFLVIDRSYPRLVSIAGLVVAAVASASLVTPILLGYLQGV